MTKNPSTTARKPRTDALRNRERILEVAKAAFTRLGANASLEEIAKRRALELVLYIATFLRGMR